MRYNFHCALCFARRLRACTCAARRTQHACSANMCVAAFPCASRRSCRHMCQCCVCVRGSVTDARAHAHFVDVSKRERWCDVELLTFRKMQVGFRAHSTSAKVARITAAAFSAQPSVSSNVVVLGNVDIVVLIATLASLLSVKLRDYAASHVDSSCGSVEFQVVHRDSMKRSFVCGSKAEFSMKEPKLFLNRTRSVSEHLTFPERRVSGPFRQHSAQRDE